MEQKLVKKWVITPGMCDYSGCLGIADIFTLFMDMASEHAEHIGLGGEAMLARGLFWITVKTKIHILKQPHMMREVVASTWPDKPAKRLCDRYYLLEDESGHVAEGRTEWAVMNIRKGMLENISELYPDELVPDDAPVCADPVRRISRDFDGCEILGTYNVRSTDIDMGGHMNNAAYVYAVMSFFPISEQKKMHITDMEVSFVSQCFEGDTLTAFIRRSDTEYEIGLKREDGTLALLVLMKLG